MSEDDFDSLLNADKKSSYGAQQELNSADIDDLLNGKKKSKQAELDDDEFDSMMNSKSQNTGDELPYPDHQVEMRWKVSEQEEDKDDLNDNDDNTMDDYLEGDDVESAFNFTDTEFDANNRDDYDVETEILRQHQASLGAIQEVDEESEQTLQKKHLSNKISSLEADLKRYEADLKSRWNHVVRYAGEDITKKCYEFAEKILDKMDDDEMEDLICEINNYIAAHGIQQVDSMAFDIFNIWSKQSDINAIKQEIEGVHECVQLL